MNAVLYYSCSGQSKKFAEQSAKDINYPVYDITCLQNCDEFEKVIIVFPVHCQGVPEPLKAILKNIKAKHVILIATYGRANHGNALYEAAKLTGNVIAAAYIPAKHTYNLNENYSSPNLPAEIKSRIENPVYIDIPKSRKTPFASVFTSFRSRLLIKIIKGSDCNGCNICNEVCPSNAIKSGKTNSKCTRCLKCVYTCPLNALLAKKGIILKYYLKKPHTDKTIIYT